MHAPASYRSQTGKLSQSLLAALVILGAVLAYFTIGTLAQKGQKSADVETVERPLFTVLALRTDTKTAPLTVSFTGRTEAGTQIIVRTETAGQVSSTVEDGAHVSVGDVLCKLEPDNRRAMLNEANAAVAKAQADYDAAARLHQEGFTADAGLKAAKAALDGALARQTQARLNLQWATIRAPFDGVVADVLADPGDVLGVGSPCATLADLTKIVVAGGVTAQDARKIKVGAPAAVTIDGKDLSGTVSYVADVADPRTRAFRIEIELAAADQMDENIQAGLAATAEIDAGEATSAVVPRNAVVFNDDGVLGVRTVSLDTEDGRIGTVKFFPIQILSEYSTGVAVSGLPPEVIVIIRGQEFTSSGTKVAIEWAASNSGPSAQ
ncbi:MAG: efflux RND transporter periplasmic adaptor subunit [Parvularcula sp.]